MKTVNMAARLTSCFDRVLGSRLSTEQVGYRGGRGEGNQHGCKTIRSPHSKF